MYRRGDGNKGEEVKGGDGWDGLVWVIRGIKRCGDACD
jgi:hypothetical protein